MEISTMEIESQNLKLRQITSSDWHLFETLHRDPNVISKCFDAPSDAELRSQFESRLAEWDITSEAWLCLVISEKSTGNAIGVTGFQFNGEIAEVGYLLLPDFFGRGYGTESLVALLDWATVNMGISKYQAVVTEGNVSSERVLEKSGFQLIKVVPQAYEIGGVLYADHIYQRECNVT